jgi:hypothetical protein
MTWFQAWIRGYQSRKEYKKLQEQRWVIEHMSHLTAWEREPWDNL